MDFTFWWYSDEVENRNKASNQLFLLTEASYYLASGIRIRQLVLCIRWMKRSKKAQGKTSLKPIRAIKTPIRLKPECLSKNTHCL